MHDNFAPDAAPGNHGSDDSVVLRPMAPVSSSPSPSDNRIVLPHIQLLEDLPSASASSLLPHPIAPVPRRRATSSRSSSSSRGGGRSTAGMPRFVYSRDGPAARERTVLSRRAAAQAHNALHAPASRLPIEVLSLIYEMVAWDYDIEFQFVNLARNVPQSMVHREPWQILTFIRIIMLVCKQWNLAALSTPRLWCYVVLPSTRFDNFWARAPPVKMALARSGAVELDVHLMSQLDISLLTSAVDPADVPALLARVRRLTLEDSDIVSPLEFRLPLHTFTSLRWLSIRHYKLLSCDLLVLLSLCPALVALYLQSLHLIPCNPSHPSHPTCNMPTNTVFLSRLNRLQFVHLLPREIALFMSKLILPQVQHLTIVRPDGDWETDEPWPHLLREVHPLAFATVRELAYYGDYLTHEEILIILGRVPNIHTLALGAKTRTFDEVDDLLASMVVTYQGMSNPPRFIQPVPLLRTLLLENCSVSDQALGRLEEFKREQGKQALLKVGLDHASEIVHRVGKQLVPSLEERGVVVTPWDGLEVCPEWV